MSVKSLQCKKGTNSTQIYFSFNPNFVVFDKCTR